MALAFKNTLARIFQVRPVNSEGSAAPLERRNSVRRPSRQTVLVEWQDVEKGAQALAGRLESWSENGFGIRAPRQIATGKTVLVTPENDAPMKAVVRHCSSTEEGWFWGIELVPHEKRRSDREPMYCAARVTCTRDGRTDDLDVIIRDASEGGLQLESPLPLAAHQLIEVSHVNSSREGIVAYCKAVGESYRIGIQFVGGAGPLKP